jgi:hypothetical protein
MNTQHDRSSCITIVTSSITIIGFRDNIQEIISRYVANVSLRREWQVNRWMYETVCAFKKLRYYLSDVPASHVLFALLPFDSSSALFLGLACETS